MSERTFPILPCRSIDDTWAFYEALGFALTLRQTRPNHYIVVALDDLELHFYGWKRHEPADSMHMVYVGTDRVDELYETFRSGLKRSLGRVPTRGLPRLGPLKDMSYGMRQFLMSDPDGIQLRVGQPISDDLTHRPPPKEKVARALHNAVNLGDSKEDPVAAARVLDHVLDATDPAPTPSELLRALVMRADMALRLDDPARAGECLARARGLVLAPADRTGAVDDLRRLAELEESLADGVSGGPRPSTDP